MSAPAGAGCCVEIVAAAGASEVIAPVAISRSGIVPRRTSCTESESFEIDGSGCPVQAPAATARQTTNRNGARVTTV